MSHDVERLAKVLYEGMPCPLGRWEDLSDAMRGTWFAIARSAMKAGVTLPTPPRATPLEAAARASVEPDHRWEVLRRRALTAAVGALSDEAIMADSQFPTPEGTEWRVVANRIRAAWLARLTEGGAA